MSTRSETDTVNRDRAKANGDECLFVHNAHTCSQKQKVKTGCWAYSILYVCVCMCMCAWTCEIICLNTYAPVLEPWMYPPAGDRRGALVKSSGSVQRRETAGHLCSRFWSECGARYGRTTVSPWAVQSRHHRRKLWEERGLEKKPRDLEEEYMSSILVSFFRLTHNYLNWAEYKRELGQEVE